MTWEIFYLICFAVGFIFSVLSFVSGTMRLHLHVPKHFSVSGLGHAPAASHVPGHGTAVKAQVKGVAGGGHFSFFNPVTFAAFLTWFGGTGYLLERLRHIWVFAGLLLSTGAGLVGAAIVFWFIARVLLAHEHDLDPLDYEMVGVLGRVSSSIRIGGTGEIIFSQEGVRRTCAARCETGESMPKGMEVVVTRYERGVAYVKPWSELADSAGITTTEEQTKQ